MALLSPRTVFAPGIKPRKAEIIQLLDALRDSGADIVAKGTKADLLLVTPDVEGDLSPVGYVFDDPVEANNGIYAWTGSTWSRERGFPDTLAALTSVGGTANAITASARTGVDPAEVVALVVQPLYTNSGSVTLSVDGAAAKPLLDFQGIALAPGAIVAGQLLILVDNGDEYRLLLPAMAVATFDHKGDYDDGTAYSEGQAVTGSDGAWYQLKIASSTGEDPVGSLTGNWLKILAEGTFPAGSVTAEKISDVIAERKAIAHKILAVSDGDVQLYVATTGDDTTGDGSIGNPFATPQRAWDSLPAIINHKYVINIADGVYSTSSRPSASMQRPALIHCDQKKMGLRSDAPGGVLTAAVVFMGESKAGVILQPGSANGYTTGVYLTGATGIVGFQNFTVDCQPGSVSGMTCHRPGTYMHVLDVDIDGNTTNTTFGMLSESKAFIEAVNVTVHDCPVGVQMISQSIWQSGLASDITNCTSGMTVTDSSWGGLSAASQCSSPILVQGGGTLDTTGQSGFRTKINANVTIRDGNWEGAFIDVTGTITTYPGARVNLAAMGWSGSWNDHGGSLYIPGCKSFIAPATQSLVATPLTFFGDTRNLYVDNTFELRNSAGNLVAESFGMVTATIANNGDTIPITIRGKRSTIYLNATAGRTGVLMPQYQGGRLANTPFPDGAEVVIVALGTSSSVQISPGTTAVLEGNTVTVGPATGQRGRVEFLWSASRSAWICQRGDPNP